MFDSPLQPIRLLKLWNVSRKSDRV